MTAVLVVEDEALIARDIQRTLVRLGYEVPTTIGTAERALREVEIHQPGLVLMDVKLRGKMDGIEAAQAIRLRFDVPVVYLTSHSDEATLVRAKATNPHGYLLKPFTDRELRTAIEVALHRHALEMRIATRERWFSTTLRSIGDAVIATDQHETVTFLNGVAERLTGWGQDALGRPLSEVFVLVDQEGRPVPSPVAACLAQSVAVELPPNTGLVVKTGRQIAVDDSASPIIDDKGQILGGVVVFRDITERRELEARVARTERLASLGTMAAGVAHEINNPLTYVTANLDFSSEVVEETLGRLRRATSAGAVASELESAVAHLESLRDALSDAHDGAERVRRIVRDLRKLARGSERPIAPVELSNVILDAVKLTAHAVGHHARVRLELGPVPRIAADEGGLGQVFVNLLLNAAEAIGDGRADDNEIVVSTRTDAAGRAVVEVKDTGPGIDPSVLPMLFDPFFTTKPVGAGMGLGLAICHSIVGAIGGQIVAENAPPFGALFRMTLPPAEPAPKLVVSTPPTAAKPPLRGRVLIVDDEPRVAGAIERILRSSHDVTVCHDGREALTYVDEGRRFDLIVCDVMMPNTSGMDVYSELTARHPSQANRMVFMTGGAFSDQAKAFLDSVPNPKIIKPFSAEFLRAFVQEHLERAECEDEAGDPAPRS